MDKRVCLWCEREFIADPATGKQYRLELAGTQICLDCADLWEDREVQLHIDKINGFLDSSGDVVHTPSGHTLPVTVESWHDTLMGARKGNAVDWFGRRWVAKRTSGNLVTLRPIGG